MDSVRARVGVTTAVVDGFAQGVFIFGLLFAAEMLALGRVEWPVMGEPTATLVAIYLIAGGAIGGVTGLGAWLVARVGPLRPARLSLGLLAAASIALFVLRATPTSAAAAFPTRVVVLIVACAAIVVASFVWARRGGGRSPRPIVRRAAVAAAAVACVGFVLWEPVCCNRLPVRAGAADDAPNVVFILVDALRADRLSSLGYGRPTTPYIDQLASQGTAFVNAYAHGNRTIISMPSLFTSIYPSYARAIPSGDWNIPLPDSQITIAELCRDAGYSTFGMMSNPYLKRPFNLTQGFDRVEEFNNGRFSLSLYRLLVGAGWVRKPRYATGVSASAKEVTDAAVDWLERAPTRSPFFCYVHYMDVHHPYLPPRVFEELFRSSDWLSSIDPAALFAKTVEIVRARKPHGLGDDELKRLSDLYDACIRYTDAEIARLVSVATRVNDRPTIVVFTSDHGDEFQEHGGLYHNNVVIEELIRVPLVIWRSDRKGEARRVDQLVRHIDVLPTLAEWIGVDVPAAAVGRSLARFVDGAGDEGPRASLSEGDYCSAVVEPGWKLMRVDTTGTDGLFDLSTDPSTRNDLASQHPDRFTRMQGSLDAYLKGAPQGDPASRGKTDAATLRQLQALGYIN